MSKSKKALFRFFPFSKKQRQLLNWWCDGSPVKDKNGIIADGAIRSGKTVAMSLSYVIWAMTRFNGYNFGMAGKTIGSFRRNVVAPLKLMLASRGYSVKDRRLDNLLEISKGGVTNTFYIFGGKDERSQDLIQGITLAGCFFDEVALMPESFVNQATARCSVSGSKWWFNCNPEGPFHWFKVNWIDRIDSNDLLYLHFTMEDNLSLAKDIIKRYMAKYTGVFYERYILGLWAVAEGIIYDMFDKEKHVTRQISPLLGGTRDKYVSIDYGTQNATVFILWEKGINGIWYATKEYYYSGRDKVKQKTDEEYVDDLLAFIGDKQIYRIIVDPSAASFIAAIKKRGLKVLRAKNDVLNGIKNVGTALQQNKIMFSEVCVMSQKEFATYAWDTNATNRGEDKPVKTNDHAMDAIRYFVTTVLFKKHGINTELEGGI